MKTENEKIKCSFCGTEEGKVALILAINKGAAICNVCIVEAVSEMNKHLSEITKKHAVLLYTYKNKT